MKHRLLPLALLSLVLGACDASTPSAVTPSPSPASASTPSPSSPPDVVLNATCHELSFYLDPSLASGYTCETIPESTDEFELRPQHTLVTFEGYPLSGTFFTPRIAVYPVSDYAALVPGAFPALTADFGNLASGGSTPVFSASFSDPLPFLPGFNAAQAFFAHFETAPFGSGDGIRYLTEFTQYTVTINNVDLFYTFQGLTDDGQYWVSAILPVNHPSLLADSETIPGGLTWEEFADGYEAYITDAVDDLDALTRDSFTPSIDALDALVASITITP